MHHAFVRPSFFVICGCLFGCTSTVKTFGNPEAGAAGGAGNPGSGGNNPASGGSAGDATGSGGNSGSGNTGTGGVSNACGLAGNACCAGDQCTAANTTCNVGTCGCSANLTACAGACVDLKTDANDCGACNHGCLGGVCDLGACQPITIADNQPWVNDLATDGTTVYWSGDTRSGTASRYIARRRVDLSDSVRVIAPAETGGYAIVASATSVYWMASNHLRVCQLPDCSGGPTDFIPAVGTGLCGYGMVLAGSKLYWTCGADYNTNDGALWSLPIPLSTTTPIAIDPTPANPIWIVSDDTNIYWINSSSYTNDNQNRDAAVYKARISDGTVTPLVTQLLGDQGAIAVGGGALFFAGTTYVNTTSVGGVFRVPLPNGVGAAVPPKLSDSAGAYDLVADDTYVYLSSSGSIARCAVAGCTTPEVIAPGEGATAVAQDAVSIYWVTGGSGSATGKIRRLAK